MTRNVDRALGALNGLLGDYLDREGNGLAVPMQLIAGGHPVAVERSALEQALPRASTKLAILVHGSMGTEADWTLPDGTDYGSLLERDHGFTPLYLRYNSGLAIADNGVALNRLLEQVVAAYPRPIEELSLIGFSMGGLVLRSACHAASEGTSSWLPLVRRAFYVGTPHRGAPLERAGRSAVRILRAIPDPYTQLIASLSDLRSVGIRDLGDADLRHQDREGRERRFGLKDREHPVPLLPSIRHHLIAGTLADAPALALLFGDALVPVTSATNAACADAESFAMPPERVFVLHGVPHPTLAHHPQVYAQIHRWLEAA